MKGQLGCVAAETAIHDIEAADVIISQSWSKAEAAFLVFCLLSDGVAEEDDLAVGVGCSSGNPRFPFVFDGHVSN